MVTHFDEKGKFFTKLVTKQPVAAVIQLVDFRISGFIHVRPDERLKNELDQGEPFLAITEATIYDRENQLLFTTSFMAINRQHILWIIPQDCVQG